MNNIPSEPRLPEICPATQYIFVWGTLVTGMGNWKSYELGSKAELVGAFNLPKFRVTRYEERNGDIWRNLSAVYTGEDSDLLFGNLFKVKDEYFESLNEELDDLEGLRTGQKISHTDYYLPYIIKMEIDGEVEEVKIYLHTNNTTLPTCKNNSFWSKEEIIKTIPTLVNVYGDKFARQTVNAFGFRSSIVGDIMEPSDIINQIKLGENA